jgi:hypothetical protein
MDWYGRRQKIVRSNVPPKSAGFRANPAVRFERLEFVWRRLIDSRFQPI